MGGRRVASSGREPAAAAVAVGTGKREAVVADPVPEAVPSTTEGTTLPPTTKRKGLKGKGGKERSKPKEVADVEGVVPAGKEEVQAAPTPTAPAALPPGPASAPALAPKSAKTAKTANPAKSQGPASPWSVVSRAGGMQVGGRPTFSPDSSLLYLPVGSDVRIYSVATGAQLHTLPGKGRGDVRRILPWPGKPGHLLVAYAGGTLTLWNAAEGQVVRKSGLGGAFRMHDMRWKDAGSPDVLYAIGQPILKDGEVEPPSSDDEEGEEATQPTLKANAVRGTTLANVVEEGGEGKEVPKLQAVLPAAEEGSMPEFLDAQGNRTRHPRRTYLYRIHLSLPPKDGRLMTKVTLLKHLRRDFVRLVDMAVAANGLSVVVAEAQYLHVLRPHTPEDPESKWTSRSFPVTRAITSLSAHPSQPLVAVGDALGQITLYYCLNLAPDEVPKTTVLHWHPHPVNDLSFTPEGSYLVSGGDEGVLVLWQVQMGTKQFLPRMGSELLRLAVSPCSTLYAVATKDNSVMVITSNLKIKQCISSLKSAMVPRNLYPKSIGVRYEPRSQQVLLNGYTGALQLYNPRTNRSLLDLDMSPRNRITRLGELQLVRASVSHAVCAPGGEWLVTVDELRSPFDAEGAGIESSLKFWRWEGDRQTYILVTRADRPHGPDVITDVQFGTLPGVDVGQPSRPIVVTTAGAKFHVWECQGEGGAFWSVRSASTYKHHTTAHACALSADGSLLAVAYHQLITVWDPSSNELLSTLLHPPAGDAITHLHFVQDTPYLLAASDRAIYVWGMLDCALVWSMSCEPQALALDPVSTRFALLLPAAPSADGDAVKDAASAQKVVVLDVAGPAPVSEYALPMGEAAVSLCFVPSPHKGHGAAKPAPSDLCLLTKSSELVLLSTQSSRPASSHHPVDKAPAPATAFSALFPKQGKPAIPKVTTLPKLTLQGMDFLQSPSHLLPGTAELFPHFIHTFLRKVGEDEEQGTPEAARSTEANQAPAPTGGMEGKKLSSAGKKALDLSFMQAYFHTRQAAAHALAPGR